MAMFVLSGDNSTDIGLSGADNTHTIPADTHSDFLVWNATDTTVDVRLVYAGPSATTVWTSGTDLQTRVHAWNNHRDFTISGNTVDIRGLQSQHVFVVRQSNADPSNAINWLDVSACQVYNSGHGTPIADGEEVHVLIYNNESI